MIISLRRVKKARAPYVMCDLCHRSILGGCLSLYGCAEPGGRPYRIWIHYECASRNVVEKLNLLGDPL